MLDLYYWFYLWIGVCCAALKKKKKLHHSSHIRLIRWTLPETFHACISFAKIYATFAFSSLMQKLSDSNQEALGNAAQIRSEMDQGCPSHESNLSTIASA